MGQHATTVPVLSNKTYDVLKYVVTIVLPALATLYSAIGLLWGAPATEQVVATIVALTTFLGATLNLSGRQYVESGAKYDGTLNVSENEAGAKTLEMEFEGDPYELDNQKEVAFRVKKK